VRGEAVSDEEKMKCPGCGASMNHHADKLVYGDAADEGGAVVEAHACPGCGLSASRPARAGGDSGE
jgi:ribosomal protein S27AE